MTHYAPLCFFMMTLASLVCGQATAIRIEITPGNIDLIKTDVVEISCLQKSQVNTIREIVTLEIIKNGKPIVFIRQNSEISFTNGNDTRLKAVGHIDKDVSKSFLNLTLMTPHSEDSGLYTCVLYYMDEVNIIKMERDSKNLTEQKFDTQSIQASLVFLKQKIQSNEKTCKDQIDHLNSVDAKVIDRVTVLERTSNNQALEIKGLTKQAINITAFTVTNSDSSNLNTQVRKVLILPKVILNIGGDFDVQRGIFTAPVDGLYVFHLTVLDNTSYCRVDMEINAGGRAVAKLYSYDNSHGDQSSVSSVVSLSAGDKVFTKMTNGGCNLYNKMFTMFSGYLIKAM